MRTPKIESLHRLIDWLNNRPNNENLPKLGLDFSAIGSNSWLSGFIEADGNFYSNFSLNSKNIVNSVKYYMRISQRKYYHNINLDKNYISSYLPIMVEIKIFLKIYQLTEINRTRKNSIEKGYEIRTVKKESRIILIEYLKKYPLFSSKYLEFLDWVQIHEVYLNKTHKTIEQGKLLFSLKKSMNSLRTEFNWEHLDKFYLK